MAENCNISVATVAEKRSHVVKISGYSVLLEKGKCAKSTPFSVGGHNLVIKYYPHGNFNSGCISIYLALDSSAVKDVRINARFTLLDKDGKPLSSYSGTTVEHKLPDKGSSREFFLHSISPENFEGLVHSRDDCFSIRCAVTVSKDADKGNHFVMVPPSDLHQQLGNLLKNMDGADVTFIVGGKRFLAHRPVLAARSSVLKAELFGNMKNNLCDPIKIDDMEADVFKSLLHFIYTDSISEEMVSPKSLTKTGKTNGQPGDSGVSKRKLVPEVEEVPQSKKNKVLDESLVGSRIKVWWPADEKFYHGVVKSFNASSKEHKVVYDDGDVENLQLEKEKWDFIAEVPCRRTNDGATRGDVVKTSHLLVAADRYNIERLKLICEEKLCNLIDSNMVATTLALAEQHSCNGLKEACFHFLALPSNFEAMAASDGFEHLKSSCPSVLKELIVRLLPVELKAVKDVIMAI